MKLVDKFGRVATDLRISLTDRCNLRCTYCMPADGMDWFPTSNLLSDSEVVRLVKIGVRDLGVTKVRFTGGEPLLRKNLEGVIAEISELEPHPVLALTTNATALTHRAEKLREAGLSRVNISLDTVNRSRFAALTRRDRLLDVLRGIEAAISTGMTVKINAVLHHEDDPAALLSYALRVGASLRFIENMPIGTEKWDPSVVVTSAAVKERLTDAGFELGLARERGSAPAEVFPVRGKGLPDGDVGFISSVSEPFCGACSRTRITADGKVRSCLFSTRETDLMELMRGGATDSEIAAVWRQAMWGKPREHGIEQVGFATPSRTMSAIGG